MYSAGGEHPGSESDTNKSSINTGKTPSDVSGSVSTLQASGSPLEARMFRLGFLITKATSVHRFISSLSFLVEFIRM